MTIYIQRRDLDTRHLETVSEHQTRKEARAELRQHQKSNDFTGHYYLSQKPCKQWIEE